MWGIFNKATGKLDCDPEPMIFKDEDEADEVLAELEYCGMYEKNEYKVRYITEDDALNIGNEIAEKTIAKNEELLDDYLSSSEEGN